MISFFVIAKISFLEILRDRFFLVLLLFSVLLLALSLVLGGLSFAEQRRILVDLGMASIHVFTVVVALFLGALSLRREIEKQTYTTVLVRPLSRAHFLLGKWLGLALLLLLSVALLSTVLAFLLGVGGAQALPAIAWGVVIESLVLLALAFFFSSFLRPFVAIFSSMGIYLIGHWHQEMAFFANQSGSTAFEALAWVVGFTTPNLQFFNFRYFSYFEQGVSRGELITAGLHGSAWIGLLLLLAIFIWEKKDLV